MMTLTILGSNSAAPTINAFQSAQLLEIANDNFLIDCGEGTQMRLRQYSSKKINKIDHIFISHAHIDHFIGLPGLLNTFALQYKRIKPVTIYAPSEVFILLNDIISMINEFAEYKINTVEIDTKESYRIFESENNVITTLPLIHGKPSCGFLFEEICNSDTIKRYAYCADTVYNEKLIPLLRNVEVLYHESTYSEKEREKALKYGHTTSKQAAIIAEKVNANQLLIGHYAGKYADPAALLEEAKSVFHNTIAVQDGLILNFK